MRYIRLNGINKITSIRYGESIVNGEIESELGELGQLMQPNGSFINDPQDEIDRQNALKQARKSELIQLMVEANALRDDAKWQLYKTEYDSL